MNTVTLICSFCGLSITKKEAHVKYSLKKKPDWIPFCNNDCFQGWKAKNKNVTLPCGYCGKDLNRRILEVNQNKSNKAFCNKSCAAKYSNANRLPYESKKRKMSIPKDRGKCNTCDKPLVIGQAKFCSRSCRIVKLKKDILDSIENGLSSGVRSSNGIISVTLRSFLFEKNNNSCELCGWNIVNINTGLVPLEVHHIDGNHTNNLMSNLQLLCPNCHALTSNFRSRNKGNNARKK
jgi:hypothetical protein